MAVEPPATILVVEDDPGIAELERLRLAEAGYRVSVAGTAEEALAQLNAAPVDLILLDYRLPGNLDGLEVFAWLRAAGHGQPVILVTGFSNEATVVEALRAGVSDFVTKSAEYLDYLPEAVARVLRMARTERALARSEARLTAILGSAKDAIITAAADRTVTFFNTAAEQMFRCPIAEAVGQPLSRFIPRQYGPTDEGGEPGRDLGSLTLVSRWGNSGVRADGEAFPIEASVARTEVAGHKSYTIVVRDVTERRRAEEQLRLLVAAVQQETSAVVITTAELDQPGPRIVFVNPAFTRMSGYDAVDVLGRTPRLFQGRATNRAVLSTCRAKLSRGEEFYGEVINYRKDGTPYHLGWHVNPIQDGTGKVTHFVSVQRDITERKRAEEAEARQARFKAFGEGVLVAFAQSGTLHVVLQGCTEAVVRHLGAAFARIWILNGETDVLELQASAGLYTHLNGPHGRIPVGQLKIGQIAQQRRPQLTNDVLGDPSIKDQEWARREGMAAFAGTPLVVENRLVGVLALFARQALLPDTLDALTSVADTIAQGIERRRAEELLRDQAVLLDQANDAILVRDLNDRIQYWNHGAERLHGWSRDEVIGKYAGALLSGGPSPELEQALREVAERGEWRGELRLRTRDGREIVVDSRWTSLLDEAGRPKASLVINADVTERKKLEAQLVQAQRMESVGRLAGGVAHDFNNLLTVISGYSEILLAGLQPGERSYELLREIHRAGERAAGLTRQLLAFGRKQILQPQVLDLNALVGENAKMLRRMIGEDVDLATALDPALGRVKADPGQFDQVLMNLVINARDAMPTGGRITIETRNVVLDVAYVEHHPEAQPGPYALVAVSDTGTGMDEATLARIFEPFYTTKEVGKGTGLGLATVYGIVKQTGGHINVYSEVGRGTVFKVYLPRLLEAVVPGPTRSEAVEAPRGSETILLVEDEVAVRTLARIALQTSGYTLLVAQDGEEGIQVGRQHPGPIHLVVTDVVMPRMSGRQMADVLSQARRGVKFLFLSGYTDDAVVRHGVIEEGVAFLQKPFTPTSLARKVREVLDGRAP